MKKLSVISAIVCIVLTLSACGCASPSAVISYPPSPAPSASPPPTATPAPSPSPVPSADPIEVYISNMSDRELIGQMVMIGFGGTKDMDSDSNKLMEDYSIGGVFLFGWNTETFSQTSKLIANIKSHSGSRTPLLIGIDLEGGSVARFKNGQWKPALKTAKKLGQLGDPELVYEQFAGIGTRLRETGINIDFAPVLDIAHNPSSTFLNARMFGSDPEKVSALIRRAIDALHDSGVASLGKHFPGLGDVSADPHKDLPVVNLTLEQMYSYAFIPFQAAIDGGADAIMITHIMYPEIDPQFIASVSPTFINEILRESMGFSGVVFSDDLRMAGIHSRYSAGESAVLHILAGGDIALIGKYPEMQKEVCESLYSALRDGTLTRGRLEQSVKRILRLKQAYCGFAPQQ